jgi:hypothetical protein
MGKVKASPIKLGQLAGEIDLIEARIDFTIDKVCRALEELRGVKARLRRVVTPTE